MVYEFCLGNVQVCTNQIATLMYIEGILCTPKPKGTMKQCESCFKWYHVECIGIPVSALLKCFSRLAVIAVNFFLNI